MMQLRALRRQEEAPRFLRFHVVVAATVAFIIVAGSVFTLPPGPLCDEGMVLFMEGGCDWGESNIFFFSKLGALLAVNAALLVAARSAPFPRSVCVPHLLLLAGLGWGFRSGGGCDSYYSHPNGSIGQMALEVAAFAILGLALVPAVRGRRWGRVVVVTLLWNAVHIGAFYAWLSVTDHWTWLHTWLLGGSMVALATVVEAEYRRRAALPDGPRRCRA